MVELIFSCSQIMIHFISSYATGWQAPYCHSLFKIAQAATFCDVHYVYCTTTIFHVQICNSYVRDSDWDIFCQEYPPEVEERSLRKYEIFDLVQMLSIRSCKGFGLRSLHSMLPCLFLFCTSDNPLHSMLIVLLEFLLLKITTLLNVLWSFEYECDPLTHFFYHISGYLHFKGHWGWTIW